MIGRVEGREEGTEREREIEIERERDMIGMERGQIIKITYLVYTKGLQIIRNHSTMSNFALSVCSIMYGGLPRALPCTCAIQTVKGRQHVNKWLPCVEHVTYKASKTIRKREIRESKTVQIQRERESS